MICWDTPTYGVGGWDNGWLGPWVMWRPWVVGQHGDNMGGQHEVTYVETMGGVRSYH